MHIIFIICKRNKFDRHWVNKLIIVHRIILIGLPLKWENEIPDFFQVYLKKNSSPVISMYIGNNQCKMRLRIQLELTVSSYVKFNLQ